MYVVGVGLVKVYKALIRPVVSGGTLHPPSDVHVRSILCVYALIKLCYTKALGRSSLVPGTEAKSLEITNLTLFTISYQYFGHLMQRADSLEKILMLEKIESN